MMQTFDNGNPMAVASGDEWTPIRNGDIFCSRACGHKCKHVDFEKAAASGAELSAALGDGWLPRVWENGGWYFSAVKGSATVEYSEDEGNFTASIDAGLFDGRHEQFRADGSSPRSAMEAALAQLDDKIASLRRTATSSSLESLKIEHQ